MIDSHTHLSDYSSDHLPAILSAASEYGLRFVICNSVNPENFQKVKEIYLIFKKIVIPCFGIHPLYLDGKEEGLKEVEERLKEIEESQVGEIGLDFRGVEEKEKSRFVLVLKFHYFLRGSSKKNVF